MGDESAKRSAEEYLAAKLTEESQNHERKMNAEAAAALAPTVWREVSRTVQAKCQEWNSITGEQSMSCKETILGDLRVLCAGKRHQITVHYDSKRRTVTIKNTARPEHEPELAMTIEGYAVNAADPQSERGARLVRNDEPANFDALLVAQLRVLSGLDRAAKI
jgi:hypothetical protein